MPNYKKIYIEITNQCNLACSFCPKSRRNPFFINREQFSTILDQVSIFPKADLFFHVLGEPLLHPLLPEFLSVAAQRQRRIHLVTNGMLIEKLSSVLLSSPAVVQVDVSLHSFEANDRPANLETYLGAIVDFTRKASQSKAFGVSLKLWNQDALGSNKNSRIIESLNHHFDLSAWSTDRIAFPLLPNVRLHQAQTFNWPSLHLPKIGSSGFCQGLRDQFGILVDGTVVPCCLDSEGAMALGNVYTTPLNEILSSIRAENIYNGFSQRRAVEDLCQTCGYRSRFDIRKSAE